MKFYKILLLGICFSLMIITNSCSNEIKRERQEMKELKILFADRDSYLIEIDKGGIIKVQYGESGGANINDEDLIDVIDTKTKKMTDDEIFEIMLLYNKIVDFKKVYGSALGAWTVTIKIDGEVNSFTYSLEKDKYLHMFIKKIIEISPLISKDKTFYDIPIESGVFGEES